MKSVKQFLKEQEINENQSWLSDTCIRDLRKMSWRLTKEDYYPIVSAMNSKYCKNEDEIREAKKRIESLEVDNVKLKSAYERFKEEAKKCWYYDWDVLFLRIDDEMVKEYK